MKRFIMIIILSLLLLNLECIAAGSISKAFELPKPTGIHAIGTWRFDLTDPKREELFSADPKTRRKVAVQVWYPTDDSRAGGPKTKLAEYMPSKAAAFFLSEQRDTAYRFPESMGRDWAKLVKTHSYWASELSPKKKYYPVLLYSPGLHSSCSLGQSIIEEMASQGYIVIGIDSPFICGAAVFQDGDVIFNKNTPPGKNFSQFLAELFPVVVDDLRFVLDELKKTNGQIAGKIFTGRIDYNNIGVFGISFGGAAAVELGITEPRIKAAANLDGGLWGDSFRSSFQKPMLFCLRENHFPFNYLLQDAWNSNQGPMVRMEITHSLHENFGDTTFLMKHFFPESDSPYPNMGTIDQERFTKIIRAGLVSFFHTQFGAGGRISHIQNTLRKYDEVKVIIK